MPVQSLPPLSDLPCGSLADLHTHTLHSPDGHQTLHQLRDAAAKAGLSVVCVTDHCDFLFGDDDFNQKQKAIAFASFDETAAAAEEENRFLLLKGTELAEALHDPKRSGETKAGRAWDYILASLHNTKGETDAYSVDFTGWHVTEAEAFFTRYLDELIAIAELEDFDALAHITYPLRYITGNYHIPVEEAHFTSRYEKIFEVLIARDKALEINTGGVRKAIGLPSPHLSLAARFYQMGGRKITMGSDAHYEQHMGADLAPVADQLQAIGFDGVLYFEKRQPKLIPFSCQ